MWNCSLPEQATSFWRSVIDVRCKRLATRMTWFYNMLSMRNARNGRQTGTQHTLPPLTTHFFLEQVVIRAVLIPLGNAQRPVAAPLLMLLDLPPAAPPARQPTTLALTRRLMGAQSLKRS